MIFKVPSNSYHAMILWAHCTRAVVCIWVAASLSQGNKAAGVAAGMVSGKCKKSADFATGLFSLKPGHK